MVDALAHVAEKFVLTLGVIVGVAIVGLAAVAVARARRGRASGAARVSPSRPVTRQHTERLSAPPRQAVESPYEVHLHFHGTSAEDVAEALRQLPD